MKKALALLLALVMCLSLAGCKSKEVKNTEALIEAIGEVSLESESAIVAAEEAYNALSVEDKPEVVNYEVLVSARTTFDSFFETVEITMDNWQDFFEIRYETLWHEDDFGDIVALTYQCYFAVRPEYVEKIILEESELIIGETCVTAYRTYNVSWENQTFSLGDYNTYYDAENLHRENFTQKLAVGYDEDLGTGNLFRFGGADLSMGDTFCLPDENGEDQRVVHYNVCTLNKIKGSIVIKGELLDLPASTLPSMPEWAEPTQSENTGSEETTEPEPVYETIEITLDNWQEYFEIKQVENWYEDDFGDFDYLEVISAIFIREEYLDKIILDSMDVVVGYVVDTIAVNYEIDAKNKVFEVTPIDEDVVYSNDGTFSFHEQMDIYEIEGCFGGHKIANLDDLENSGMTDENGNPMCDYGIYQVTRIEGTITIIVA